MGLEQEEKHCPCFYQGLFLFLGCAFYALTVHYAVNCPKEDDFDVFLRFLNEFLATPDYRRKFQILFTRHNEHYVVLGRIAALLLLKISGTVNFRLLIALGNISLLLLPFLLIKIGAPDWKVRPLAAVPVLLLLFQPQYAEATQWATASWQFISVFTLGLFSFYCAFRPSAAAKCAALISACLAPLALGNGVLIPGVIGLVCLANRRYRETVLWLSLFVVFIVYFPAPGTAAVLSGALREYHLLPVCDYTLSLIGSALAFSNHGAALAAGIALILSFSLLTGAKLYQKDAALYGSLLFLLLSAAANALTRINFGLELSYTSSRYTLISALLIAAVYLSVAKTLNNRRFAVAFTAVAAVLSMIFSAASFAHSFSGYNFRYQQLSDSLLRWQVGHSGLRYSDQKQGTHILAASLENGVFAYTPINLTDYRSAMLPVPFPQNFQSHVIGIIEHRLDTDSWLLVDGWLYPESGASAAALIYLTISGKGTTWLFSTAPRIRPDVSALFLKVKKQRKNLDHSGFLALIDKTGIPPGEYKVGVLVAQDGLYFHRTLRENMTVK